MKKFLKSLSFALISFLFPACSIFNSDVDKIVDDYVVLWINEPQQRTLNKGEQLIPPYVFAVGHNSRFIFAKRHELVLINGQQEIDESAAYCYIIERTKSSFQDKPIYGPLSEETFIMKCAELGIKEPKFDLLY